MLRVRERLKVVVPITLFLIFFLLYMNTKSAVKAGIVMLAVPFSVVGAVWLMYLLGYNVSIAAWVGMIALMGLDAETGVFMLLFLDLVVRRGEGAGTAADAAPTSHEAIVHGAVKRIRPKMMTVAAAFMGLMPIMWSMGTGADVMKRVAAPMVGGLATSFLLELLVYPAIYLLWKLAHGGSPPGGAGPGGVVRARGGSRAAPRHWRWPAERRRIPRATARLADGNGVRSFASPRRPGLGSAGPPGPRGESSRGAIGARNSRRPRPADAGLLRGFDTARRRSSSASSRAWAGSSGPRARSSNRSTRSIGCRQLARSLLPIRVQEHESRGIEEVLRSARAELQAQQPVEVDDAERAASDVDPERVRARRWARAGAARRRECPRSRP